MNESNPSSRQDQVPDGPEELVLWDSNIAALATAEGADNRIPLEEAETDFEALVRLGRRHLAEGDDRSRSPRTGHSHCALVLRGLVAAASVAERCENSWCAPDPKQIEGFALSSFVIVQEAERPRRLHCRRHHAENSRHFRIGWAGSADPAETLDPPCRTEGLSRGRNG